MMEGYKIGRLTMLWIMILLVVVCLVATHTLTNNYWKVELVKRGHAKWVVTNEKGTVEWQWTTPK